MASFRWYKLGVIKTLQIHLLLIFCIHLLMFKTVKLVEMREAW